MIVTGIASVNAGSGQRRVVKAGGLELRRQGQPARGYPMQSQVMFSRSQWWRTGACPVGALQAGQTVLVHAAAGGLGSVAIPIAKHLGCIVYATTSGKNVDYVRELGADVVIDYQTMNYADIIRAQEPHGVDLVLQSLLDEAISRDAIGLCKDRGTVVYLNNEPPEVTEIEARQIKTKFLHHRPDGQSLGNLMNLYASGVLRLPPVEVFPLNKARDAHIKSESGRTVGKIVLHIQDLQ